MMKIFSRKKWPESDAELVTAIQSSDRVDNNRAFLHIYERYRPEIMNYLRGKSFVGEEDQREIFQIALLRIVENKANLTLPPGISFLVLLKSYVKNVVFEKYREVKKGENNVDIHSERVSSDLDVREEDDLGEYLLELDPHLHESLDNERSVVINHIREALLELTGKYCREIFTLKYFYHYTDEDIAEELNKSRQTIVGLKNGRCPQELEQILRKKGVGIPKIHRNL